MIVTASRDRSLRIWRRTDEQVNARAPQAERPFSPPVPVPVSVPVTLRGEVMHKLLPQQTIMLRMPSSQPCQCSGARMSDHHRTALFLSPSLSPPTCSLPSVPPTLIFLARRTSCPPSTIAQVSSRRSARMSLSRSSSSPWTRSRTSSRPRRGGRQPWPGRPSEATNAGRRTIESVKGAERYLRRSRPSPRKPSARKSTAPPRRHGSRSATECRGRRRRRPRWVALRPPQQGGRGEAAAKPPVLVPNMLLLGLDEEHLLKALSSVRRRSSSRRCCCCRLIPTIC